MVATPEAAEIRTVPYFLVLLRRGENHDAAAEHYPRHVQFITTLEAANTVLLGGSFGSPIDGAEAAYLLHVASRWKRETSRRNIHSSKRESAKRRSSSGI